MERVTWERAWEAWGEATADSLEKWGPLSLFFYRGYGSLYFSRNLLANVFAHLGGYSGTSGSLCGAAGGAGLRSVFGGETPVFRPETIGCRSGGVLLWGRNAIETHVHLLPFLDMVRKRGGEVSALEIRRTKTTDYADRWWRVRPATDALLALLLCRELLVRGEAVAGWRDHSLNPDEFESMAKGVDVNLALTACGMDARAFDEMYRWLLASRPVAIYGGYGIQRYMSGSRTYMCLAALSLLLGAFTEPGNGVVFGKNEMAMFPGEFAKTPPVRRLLPVAEWHRAGFRRPRLGAAVFVAANPAKQGPGSGDFAAALQEIPFSVCLDHFMTETAMRCNLVLPSASFLEEGPDWRGSWWHSYLLRSVPVMEPPGEALPDTAIFAGLARAVGVSCDPVAECREMDRQLRSDPRLDEIAEGIYSFDEPDTWSQGDRVIRLPEDPPRLDSPCAGAAIRLVSVHVADYINGQIWGVETGGGLPLVRLSKDDAAEAGVSEGDTVRISGEHAKGAALEAKVCVDTSLGKGYCVMRQGAGDINRLTCARTSPGSGAPFHESFVRIEKQYGKSDNSA